MQSSFTRDFSPKLRHCCNLELILFGRYDLLNASNFNYCAYRAGGGVMTFDLIANLHLHTIHQREILKRIIMMTAFAAVLLGDDYRSIRKGESKPTASGRRKIGDRCKRITAGLNFFVAGNQAGGQENNKE